MIPDTAELLAEDEVVTCPFGDGLALLDLRSGKYFSVNSVAAFIWSKLAKPSRVADIRDAMMRQYETTEAQCSADLQTWLASMVEAKLIKASHAAAA